MIENRILQSVKESIAAVSQLAQPHMTAFIQQFAELIVETHRRGNKILIAGNGGSLCDANHFAEELTGFFRQPREALPAIALSEPGYITCVGNDVGFDQIFSRAIEALGKPGDLFIGLTTSGNSPNLVRGIQAAQQRGLKTVAFLGKGGGRLKGVADLELIIEHFTTSDRIQEAHMAAMHIAIEHMEYLLFHPAEVTS